MKPFAYERADSLETAQRATARGARTLAGGTDLVPLMQEHVVHPARLVDVSTLADGALRTVELLPDGGLRLGALLTLAEIARHAMVRRAYPALAQAALSAGTPQIRNVATLGGNLCQWNRCWYFRDAVPCHLNGGDGCPAMDGDHRFHAVFRDGPCIAVHPSDPAVALLAFEARVQAKGMAGAREVPLAAFLRPPGPGRPEQADLQPGEVLTAVILPPAAGRSGFEKAMERQAWAFALVSVAAVVELRSGRVAHARLALGGVAGVPRAAVEAARSLEGLPLDAEAVDRAAALAVRGAQPLMQNGYKVDLAQRLVRAVLLDLAAEG